MTRKRVPLFSGARSNHHVPPVEVRFNSPNTHAQYESREAGIGDDNIAAAPKHKERRASRARPLDPGQQCIGTRGLSKIASWPADPERRHRRKRHVLAQRLLEFHVDIWTVAASLRDAAFSPCDPKNRRTKAASRRLAAAVHNPTLPCRAESSIITRKP